MDKTSFTIRETFNTGGRSSITTDTDHATMQATFRNAQRDPAVQCVEVVASGQELHRWTLLSPTNGSFNGERFIILSSNRDGTGTADESNDPQKAMIIFHHACQLPEVQEVLIVDRQEDTHPLLWTAPPPH